MLEVYNSTLKNMAHKEEEEEGAGDAGSYKIGSGVNYASRDARSVEKKTSL